MIIRKFVTISKENLAGYSPWGHKESDTTERLSTTTSKLWHVCVCQCFGIHSNSIFVHGQYKNASVLFITKNICREALK